MSLFFPRFIKGFGLHGMQEVGGSIPPGSTNKNKHLRDIPSPQNPLHLIFWSNLVHSRLV